MEMMGAADRFSARILRALRIFSRKSALIYWYERSKKQHIQVYKLVSIGLLLQHQYTFYLLFLKKNYIIIALFDHRPAADLFQSDPNCNFEKYIK